MAVEASSAAEPASTLRLEMVKADMIDLRPPRHRSGAIPLGASGSASVVAAAIMALAKGFARDGFGAFWRGFEISVRWTSC
ncbi:hypothetical protein MesoLj131a_16300 [Mesorhizobium sp. 131-2-1]|nr:hypothetical protein MesoLj131a_16300 [Mesorhizobium sp. 131-2-1]